MQIDLESVIDKKKLKKLIGRLPKDGEDIPLDELRKGLKKDWLWKKLSRHFDLTEVHCGCHLPRKVRKAYKRLRRRAYRLTHQRINCVGYACCRLITTSEGNKLDDPKAFLFDLLERARTKESGFPFHDSEFVAPLGPPGGGGFHPEKNPHYPSQAYLGRPTRDCTTPCNVIHGWEFCGGLGEHVRLCDVESAWDVLYLDLPNTSLLHGDIDKADGAAVTHGTFAAGVVASKSNDRDGVGIVPDIDEITLSSHFDADRVHVPEPYRLFEAIIMATHHLVFPPGCAEEENGNVLLLEVGAHHGDLPVEIIRLIHCAIKLATANNVVVIEPAGNGSQVLNCRFRKINRSASRPCIPHRKHRLGDSGAIMVGAIDPMSGQVWKTSCTGHRVDCHGWGDHVYCVESHTGRPLRHTSAAAAQVAGIAAMLQSIYKRFHQKKNPHKFLSPAALRRRFHAASHDCGTPVVLNVKTAMNWRDKKNKKLPRKRCRKKGSISNCFFTMAERREPQNRNYVWTPPLTPHECPPFPGSGSFPLRRGGPVPSKPDHPKTGSEMFDLYVNRVVECAHSFNKALKKVKDLSFRKDKEEDYRRAVMRYRDECASFAQIQDGMGKDANGDPMKLVDPETIFVEPIMSAGFIVDLCIIAHPSHGDELGGPNFHSESSYVSAYPSSSSMSA